ncbi:MAG: hypothetical protein GF308_22300 [Candidatus Heimdallarchaeota archaeon]|nr:hypothetical protein [Candidatus Heimdallarchaeota archaeon]
MKRIHFATVKDLEIRIKNKSEKISDNEITLKVLSDWIGIEKITKLVIEKQLYSKIIRLSNFNNRLALSAYFSFLKFLWKKRIFNKNSSLIYEFTEHSLDYYFYSWLIEENRLLNQILEPSILKPLKFSLKYFILAYLYNKKYDFQMKGDTFRIKLEEIIIKLSQLEFKDKEIKKAILKLFNEPSTNRFHKMIEISSKDYITDIKSLKNDYDIWILPQGEIAILDITQEYNFLMELIHSRFQSKFEESIDLTKISNYHIEMDIQFLCEYANNYLEMLIHIKDKLKKKHKEDWLKEFKRNFSINQTLLLNRIIKSHLTYLRRNYPNNKLILFEKIQKQFNQQIRAIENDLEYRPIIFSRLLQEDPFEKAIIKFKTRGIWTADDLREFIEGIMGVYNFFLAIRLFLDLVKEKKIELDKKSITPIDIYNRMGEFSSEEKELSIYSIQIASPGEIIIEGIKEAIDMIKGIIESILFYKEKKALLRLEIWKKYYEFKEKHPNCDEFTADEAILHLNKNVKKLEELKEKGKIRL